MASTFEVKTGHNMPPRYWRAGEDEGQPTLGPKQTNKFWTNWVTGSAGSRLAIYPMPYSLRWSYSGGGKRLIISHSGPENVPDPDQPDRPIEYSAPFTPHFVLGAADIRGRSPVSSQHRIVKEDLTGFHAEVRGPGGKRIIFPIYSGSAYVSAFYAGGLTPMITTAGDTRITEVRRWRNGIWKVRNHRGVEFRVYALDDGNFVADRFRFVQRRDRRGRVVWQMNRPFEGWIRIARASRPHDRLILDHHARSVLVGCNVQVEEGGLVRYNFEKEGPADVAVLNFAWHNHMRLLQPDSLVEVLEPQGFTPLIAPTKGYMTGIVGDTWTLRVDTAESDRVGFLLEGSMDESHQTVVKEKLETALSFELRADRCLGAPWEAFACSFSRWFLTTASYYNNGKGLQKVADYCLLAEKFFGHDDQRTQLCGHFLARAFRCYYARDEAECGDVQAPVYDEDWGGIVNSQGYDNNQCAIADFGNACYNDHAYQYGYFVVAAAALVKLLPEYGTNQPFLDFVDALVRDTTNPSRDDPYFPQFRSFDWFDLHSWGHGVTPEGTGKDVESTSEDINLYYGIKLWGEVTGRDHLKQLGSTMLALVSTTVREFFLIERGNPNHPAEFVNNHVTGIFFQNRVQYREWSGVNQPQIIHGLQMMPLSPATLLVRTPSFCQQEWEDVLGHLPLEPTDPWTSLLLAGNLAIHQPEEAYRRLKDFNPLHVQAGITSHVLLVYWAAALASH